MKLLRNFIVSYLILVAPFFSASATNLLDEYAPEDFRGAADEKFKIWPYIPFIRAADLDDFQQAHSRTRKEKLAEYVGHLKELTKVSGDIDKSLKALLVLDKIYEQHRTKSLDGMGFTLEEDFKASLNGLYRVQRVPYRKLQFVNSTSARDIVQNISTYMKMGQVPMGEWDYGKWDWDFNEDFKTVRTYVKKPTIHKPYDGDNPPVDMFMYGTYTVQRVDRKLEVKTVAQNQMMYTSFKRDGNSRNVITTTTPMVQKDEHAKPVMIKVTLTMVKLSTGESESFKFTAVPEDVTAPLAFHVFKFFHGRRLVPYKVVKNKVWLPQAPGHVSIHGEDKDVQYSVAKRTCERQGARLPTQEEYEDGMADGEFFEGLNLQEDGYGRYFVASEEYNSKVEHKWERMTLYFIPGTRSANAVITEAEYNNHAANYRCVREVEYVPER